MRELTALKEKCKEKEVPEFVVAGIEKAMQLFEVTEIALWDAKSENVLSDMCAQRRLKSDCAFAQSD